MRIDGGSRLVEDHHGRVRDRRAGDGEQLSLSLREVGTVRFEHGVEAVGQAGDEVVSVGDLCRFDAVFVRGVQLAVTDILHYRPREEVGVLQDHAQRPAQIGLFDLVDIDAVVTYLAVVYVIEAIDEVGYRGLARARRAHERHFLPGFGIERDVFEYELFGRIAEVHMLDVYVAFELFEGGRIRGFVIVFPSPKSRARAAFGELAVFVVFGAHERDIAVVLLGLFVYQGEYALRARDTHGDGVDLLRDHAHLAGEHHAQLQEHDHDRHVERPHIAAQADIGDVGEDKDRADDGDDDISHIAHVGEYGHEDIAVLIRLFRRVEEFVVDVVESLFRFAFVNEDLDDLLTLQGLFDIAVHLAQGVLLTDKVFDRFARDMAGNEHHRHGAKPDDYGEPETV